MTIVLDIEKKQMTSVKVNTYLEKPEDKVAIEAALAAFPQSGSHLQQGTIVGQSKALQIEIKNSDYKKR